MIDEEIHRDDDDGDEHDKILHDRIIARADRLDEKARDAGNVEHGLGDDEPADQKRGLDADDSDDRQQCVAQRVIVIDAPCRGALGARGADIILAQHFKHRGARQPHDQRRGTEADGGGRHGVEEQLLPQVFRRFGVDRNRAEAGDKDHQDEEPEPEGGHRQPGEAEHPQEIIDAGILLDRADHAKRNADRDREDEGHEGEFRRHRNARRDLLDRRLLGDVGIAEIAPGNAADPGKVLDRDRPVQAKLTLDLRLLRRVHHAGRVEEDVDDVAWYDAEEEEDDDGDAEERHQHQREPPHEVRDHSASSSPACETPTHLSSQTSSNRYPL